MTQPACTTTFVSNWMVCLILGGNEVPSLDPHDKRLAVEVEGYPSGAAAFWAVEGSQSAEAALQKGDLKFMLDGERLKGSWRCRPAGLTTVKSREKKSLVHRKGQVRGKRRKRRLS